ncbi:hypothetical protein [Halorubellus salinus]|uniref:hypothetical protein n=1 Tax=Halorubellus salinus TaxID=755309 RepID=UPI001D062D44|nr:hypothetical protein [Halorubellus salinus]
MYNENPQLAKITFRAEDNISDVADESLVTIRDSLLEEATSDDTNDVVGPAAVAVEANSRISNTDEPPTHIDPRDEIDDIESLTDDTIRKYNDDLARSATRRGCPAPATCPKRLLRGQGLPAHALRRWWRRFRGGGCFPPRRSLREGLAVLRGLAVRAPPCPVPRTYPDTRWFVTSSIG